MGSTSNYSWPYPESSDFVADGATAIEDLADAVDQTLGSSTFNVNTTNNDVNIGGQLNIYSTLGGGGITHLPYTNGNNYLTADASGTGGSHYFRKYSGGVGTDQVVIRETGRVGIGTMSPSSLLEVSGAGFNGGQGNFVSTNSANSVAITGVDSAGINDVSYLVFSDQNTWGFISLTGTAATAGDMRFFLNNGERMRIKSNGNVGIGTGSPTERLHVGGNAHIGNSTTYNGTLSVKRGSGTDNYLTGHGNFAASFYHASNSGSSHGVFVANQWQNDTSRLLVMGNIDATGVGFYQKWYATGMGRSYNYYGTWGTISDETLKTEIVDANPQLPDIVALRFVNYKFTNDVEQHGDDAPRLFGLIAQEVEQISPGLVNEHDGIKTVNTSVLGMKAVKAIQELNDRIDTLETQIGLLSAS